MAATGLDTYIADTKFRSRNPLFKTSETYHTEKEKRRLKCSKGRQDYSIQKTSTLIKTQWNAVVQQVGCCGFFVKTLKATVNNMLDLLAI